MNDTLFRFYQGTGKDIHGRTLAEILAMTDYELEKSHTVVQWMFPLKEPSAHNPKAPLLDDETIQSMKNDNLCMQNLRASAERFWSFLTECPSWITKRNHNFLRLTRIIKCYKIFAPEIAEKFYLLAQKYYEKFPHIIGEETKTFWDNAYKGE